MKQDTKKIQEWEKRIADWEQTNLTIPQWCKKNGINRTSMYEWYKRLRKKGDKKKQQNTSFVELSFDQEEKLSSGISISLNDFTLHLDKVFEKETLFQVLSLVKELS